jgi:two-component system C4-dicarboxylate transport sensor histidine kinase DctB
VEPSDPDWGDGPPPDAWLARVNRHAVAVRLLATTVHDVNNILQVMSGAAEVLALEPTPTAVAKRTTSIVSQSVAATSALHALTTFVREESDPGGGARALALASRAVAFREHALRKARLAVSVDGDDAVCAMASHRLLQVMLNLLLNAEEALAGRANGTIGIVVADGTPVVLTVTDNGEGLSPERIAALGSWPPRPGLTAGALGIGLRVARRFVEDAGGTLAIESGSGGGVRAVVSVPRLS